MIDAGLILEGGGMKGIYTAGVLDFFQDKGLEFSSVYGVSAGACQLCSYISKQRGRGRDVLVDYLHDKRFMGVWSLVTTGDIFGADFNYNLVPNKLNPFDYETFDKYEGNAYAVVTNIVTGKPEYIKIKDLRKDIVYVRASSSLPIVSRNVEANGNLYLDGGLAESIPIFRSLSDGNRKNIVVMTKPVGYRKKQESALELIKLRYKKYPYVYELCKNRHKIYNDTVDYIEKERDKGSLFLIQPKADYQIDRLERNKEKLMNLYKEGYEEAKESYDAMMEYLNK